MGFSLTKTIQLLGYPHDYGSPQIVDLPNFNMVIFHRFFVCFSGIRFGATGLWPHETR